MDINKHLILLKGEDKTNIVKEIKVKENKVDIKLYNNNYTYNLNNVVIRNNPQIIDFEGRDVYYKNQILFNIFNLIRFDEYIKVIYNNELTDVFRYEEITLKPICNNERHKSIIGYFKEIANYLNKGSENTDSNTSFLAKEYNKLNYIDAKSVLSYYINKKNLKTKQEKIDSIIYPFRFNISQRKAIENVYKKNVSIIQGPPGTGKTQTILNIVANLAIMQDKTVAVVSNNNEAVKNVKDKLDKNRLWLYCS